MPGTSAALKQLTDAIGQLSHEASALGANIAARSVFAALTLKASEAVWQVSQSNLQSSKALNNAIINTSNAVKDSTAISKIVATDHVGDFAVIRGMNVAALRAFL